MNQLNFDVNLNDLYKEYLESYKLLSSLDRITTPYITTDPLFGRCVYKEVTREIILSFFSIYLRHKHNRYATCYQMNLNVSEISELNKALCKAVKNGNKNLGEIIHLYILKHNYKLDNLLTLFLSGK